MWTVFCTFLCHISTLFIPYLDVIWTLFEPRLCVSGFLCPLSANVYGLDFLNFTISDYETKAILFEIGRDNPAPPDVSIDFGAVGEDMYRKIKYTFSEDVLKLPYIQTS